MPRQNLPKFSEIRIIGGTCRGRKIKFPELEGLRPTPNRIRETLFNWLAPSIQGANCLDLFAGSGALGFEALSRGAQHALMLDASADICHALMENKNKLGLASAEIVQANFPYPPSILATRPYDIVFLDPPFHCGYVQQALEWLKVNCLPPGALIYIESESRDDVIPLPLDWQILKDKRAGNVRYTLITN
ncbi:MAG: 16S rRNA (guanine(966)-N(2))-methyltransferase RsmD [Gammaproteobacteria bacterium]|nr:16S rRNA (guanine(966)-N(2))-methyltransferase RsmD [Gammaproteobacteria bacterium]